MLRTLESYHAFRHRVVVAREAILPSLHESGGNGGRKPGGGVAMETILLTMRLMVGGQERCPVSACPVAIRATSLTHVWNARGRKPSGGVAKAAILVVMRLMVGSHDRRAN